MHRLLEFIKRIYVVLLFLLLEGIAIWQYATSTPYTEAKILSRTTAVGGYVSTKVTNIGHFFKLSGENNLLTRRIAELEQQRDAADAAAQAGTLQPVAFRETVLNVLQIVKDPQQSESAKNAALRSVLSYIVYEKPENRLALYFFT